MTEFYNVVKHDIIDNVIEQGRLFNVYVIGQPRSGTSMLTNIVRHLGVNIIQTSEDPKFKKLFVFIPIQGT